MPTTRLSLDAARRLALRAQLLHGMPRLPRGKEGVARVVEELGYVQIDTIAVIERAHHHTLWTRRPDYAPGMLDELLAVDRRVFEYWGHAASYLPVADYRFYLPRMRRFEDPEDPWVSRCLELAGELTGPVLERIREEGALSAKDFDPPPGRKRGKWWQWKPAKIALELLFGRGELMVSERRNFQRVYDLRERVLPAHADTRCPDDDELGRFLVRRALGAMGVAGEAEIREHIRAAKKEVVVAALRALLAEGEVVEVSVRGVEAPALFALREILEAPRPRRGKTRRVRLLSPFDNLVIQRERLRWLFGFDYTIECYVPAGKRKHGYFVLPVLWGEELVGRLDPRADRKREVLEVRSLSLEPGCNAGDELLAGLAEALAELARFNGCTKVRIARTRPRAIAAALRRLVPKEI